MGSQVQGRWARSAPSQLPKQRSAPARVTVRDSISRFSRISVSGRDPRLIGGLLVAAWVLPIITHLLRADAVLIVLIVYITGGLLRMGGTVLDRLMVTVGLLIGTAIAAGIAFSFWPFGLNPVAVGGTALTVLLAIGVVLQRRPRWPRRVLGSDLVLVGGAAAGAAVAFGPLWNATPGHRLAFSMLTGDRVRHFSLFDSIHRLGGYTYLLQGKAKPVVDPGMLAVYPPGQHYTYALLDIFVTSRTNPGNPLSELLRYEIYTCLGYGFFVLCVAWGARWVAGPAMAGWRRTFMVAAIGSFLCTGVLTTSIWSGWDPQVLGMGLLALTAACAFRPPAGGRLYIVLMAALTIAIFLTYELFAPFVALMLIVSGWIYRKRWLPHWRLAAVVAVVAAPISVSELVSAKAGGLQSTQAALSIGFTTPMSWQSLVIIGALSLAGFATLAARRRPSAVAALIGGAACGLAVLAFWAYQESTIHTTSYYFEKAVQAWVIVALVGVGTAGHLLRRPRVPGRGLAGAAVACGAVILGFVATDPFWAGPIAFTRTDTQMSPGPHTTWARVWSSGQFIFPSNQNAMATLRSRGLLGDGKPTLAVWYGPSLENVNLSLAMATLNHDDGQISSQIYQLNGLENVGNIPGLPLNAAQQHDLAALEAILAGSTTPLRVIVGSATLAHLLRQWEQQHPEATGLKQVLLIPNLGQ